MFLRKLDMPKNGSFCNKNKILIFLQMRLKKNLLVPLSALQSIRKKWVGTWMIMKILMKSIIPTQVKRVW